MAPASDIYLVWEDDDCQLPWCLKTHAKACEQHGWSYPSHVWSDYGEASYPPALRLHTEPCGGRFHGALGITGKVMIDIGGWPQTRQANFDQQMIGRLYTTGQPGDPLLSSPAYRGTDIKPDPGVINPPYLFRWHTGQAHGQSTMRGGDDEGWYDRYSPPDSTGPHTIVPAFDDDTQVFYQLLTS
jgi:hypothetical protein